ncbi:hypothetical protein WA577_002085, partial [Blastocystis sp. JDR]
MTVKYLLIEYYTLMKRMDRLPDLPVIERYVDDVFVYMKERDIQYSVHIIAWLCELLISYSSRKELTLEERIGVLRDVVPELLKCSSLFTRTNYDNKIQYFNLLKKQYIAVVLRLVTLGDGIRDVERRERLTKRCRRCIKIFNNDDFYYFFANIEEETSPLFALFASPS